MTVIQQGAWTNLSIQYAIFFPSANDLYDLKSCHNFFFDAISGKKFYNEVVQLDLMNRAVKEKNKIKKLLHCDTKKQMFI